MALDSVRAIKFEAPGAEGGTQLDLAPTELNPLQDALTAAGLFVNGPSVATADKVVLLDRTGSSLRLTDGVTSHILGELVSNSSGQVGSHNALTDVIHFLGEGPGDGWASGAALSVVMNGPLLASKTWYIAALSTKKIVSTAYTYNGPLLATTKLTLYAADGATIVRTVTDTYSYNGPVMANCVRTWGTT